LRRFFSLLQTGYNHLLRNQEIFGLIRFGGGTLNSSKDLSTFGRVIYPGYPLMLWHRLDEDFNPSFGYGQRFRMVLVEQGSGILEYGHGHRIFGAPTLFCLGERERPQLIQCQDLQAQALYFHPNVINGSFTFESVRQETAQSEWHDHIWLKPFLLRDDQWTGQVKLGPATAARISRLFAACSQELAMQRDNGWPCRSRSFFLEILFLIDRLSVSPDVTEQDELSEAAALTDVGPILLYIHNHYNEKISLDCLSQNFHTNRTTLTEQFRQTTGLPVMSYISRLRINLASLMLRDTQLSINEIVERTGYTNPTHFGRAFRKYTGYTPSEYRRHFSWMS
jgi:AraC-like DNA-binding protein